MLTQRTNVLFTPQEHNELFMLSRAQDKTMGELIRLAVRQTYKIRVQDNTLSDTFSRIKSLTKNINTKNLNYRKLVTQGRKYD